MLKKPESAVVTSKTTATLTPLVIPRKFIESHVRVTNIPKIKISKAIAKSGICGEFSIRIDSDNAA